MTDTMTSEGRAAQMKKNLIDTHEMELVEITRYNEVWEGADYVLIWNRITNFIKLKPKNY